MKHYFAFKSLFTLLLLMLSFGVGRAQGYNVNKKYPDDKNKTTDVICVAGNSVQIPLKSYVGDGSVFARVFLADAHTLDPLYELTSSFEVPSDYGVLEKALFLRTEYGYINFPRWNSTRTNKNIILNLPSGKDLADLAVVVLKKNVDGTSIDDENKKAADLGIKGDLYYSRFNVTSDPTSWDAYRVYTFEPPKPFIPYEGVANAKGDFETSADGKRKRQRTHYWTYDYYVAPGSTITLKAPIPGYSNIDFNTYWRWYDNNTFAASPRISNGPGYGEQLQHSYCWENGNSIGLVYADSRTTENPVSSTNRASVRYAAPSDPSWTGDDIVADASRYTDGEGYEAGATAFREPTLSSRFIWHIRPCHIIADNIKQAILHDQIYEDHGNITIGLKDKSSKSFTTLRLDLHDLGQYWFYPYDLKSYGQKLNDLDFGTNVVQAKSLSWYILVRQGGKIYKKDLGKNSQFNSTIRYDLHVNDMVGTYTNVLDEKESITLNELKLGHEYIVTAYANSNAKASESGNKQSPVASFNCYFAIQHEPQLASSISSHRSLKKLEELYTNVGVISFDDYAGMTLEKPGQIYTPGATNNNSWDRPLSWDKANYGFVFPQLVKEGKANVGYANFGAYACFHGEYTLVKQAGGDAKFSSGKDKYTWWYRGTDLKDRTYVMTNGKQSGYFLYVDASDEARPIVELDFEAKLCSGSTIICSAAVADLTSGDEPPHLLFKLYGVKKDATGQVVSRNLIQTFSSGDFKSHEAKEKSTWYQVFAKTFINPDCNVDGYTSYAVTIDNNCKSTMGADYAIDDIRFYVANDKLEVMQEGSDAYDCDKARDGAKLRVRMDYSMLRSYFKATSERTPLYYRICKKDGTPVKGVEYPSDGDVHGRGEDADGNPYGWVLIDPSDEVNLAKNLLETDAYGMQHFVLVDTYFTIPLKDEYFFSGALPERQADGTYRPGAWGNKGVACSIYSKMLNIVFQQMVVNGQTGSVASKVYANCGETNVNLKLSSKLSVPDATYGGRLEIDWKFDWFVGSKTKYEEFVNNDGLEALKRFRAAYPEATDLQSVARGTYTTDDYNLLKHYTTLDNPFTNESFFIVINGQSSLNATLNTSKYGDVHTNLYAVPIKGLYTDKATNQKYEICPDPISTPLVLSHQSPQIYLGFPQVDYPDALENTAKYVRLGLKQANDLKKGTLLQLPLHSYRDAQLNEGADRGNLLIEEDNGENKANKCVVRLVATNDPMMKSLVAEAPNTNHLNRYKGGKVAEVVEENHRVTPSTKHLSIDFSKNKENVVEGTTSTQKVTNLDFHEGYDYTFAISYHDASKTIGGSVTICYAYTFFTLRVIPEYVTWTGAVPTNTNWNNDGNWRRSSRAELDLPYRSDLTVVGAGTEGGDESTSDMAENYAEYGSNQLPKLQQMPGDDPDDTPQAFVPMKFTKVIIKPGTSVPFLGDFKMNESQGIISNLLNPNLSDGTAYIAYDLMVKTEKEGNTYTCEPFYANTCDQVFFRTNKLDAAKDKGQIGFQHYLKYKTAWVDFWLRPNQWNLMSSPLQGVYAGDFYLPKASGVQKTEAFRPIHFNLTQYSRTDYPVYQRNWNMTESHVYKNDGSSYNATVPFDKHITDTLAVIHSQWSHTYNDVQVPYLPGRGFAVLPSLKGATDALFRLPKADASYAYYDYKGNQSTLNQSVDRGMSGRLATSLTQDDDPTKLNGMFDVTLNPSTEVREGYFLLGNPYMGTLEMSSFFADNPALYAKYWTYNEKGEMQAFGGGKASELGKMPPMRAFFVKSKVGGNPTVVHFKPKQCTTEFYAAKQGVNKRRNLSLSATTASGATTLARLIADPAASDDFDEDEDVETLFDSNLSEQGAPQLFTVAGARAASINSVSDLRNVALGVSTAEDCDVELRLTGVDELSEPLYLYDALNRTTRPVREGETLTIRSNAMGRYILTSKAMVPESAVRTAIRCYPTGQQGRVVASTEPTDRIRQIQVYDNLGRLRQEFFPNEPTHTFSLLPREVFLVTILTDGVPEGRTFKVIPR